ncbi:hypothetical protein BXY85_1681 [Roseivirga pacifica]|uniref:Uncharacterized protein n=1 Tax=Roseivirga pacifica TaxID=1267423 RepID=A0A1I0MSE7_9BACT|nr:hypothetical protein [Roseivirga pacifica]RKQ50664.1 hypothetical protein BXY85_1681 [Roseivirga pacifica]SEV91625.1 hypothetical protein SAMN05216290_0664 [Roseivirga pacifica]
MKKNPDQREDHLAPTQIPSSNDNKEVEKAGLTDHELRNRLDMINKYSRTPEESFGIQKIQKEYMEELRKREEVRGKVALNYSMSVEKELLRAPYEQIQLGYESQDQELRDDITAKAKAHYNTNNSLSKDFRESKQPEPSLFKHSFDKAKYERAMDK